jgi:hypothetical protein
MPDTKPGTKYIEQRKIWFMLYENL